MTAHPTLTAAPTAVALPIDDGETTTAGRMLHELQGPDGLGGRHAAASAVIPDALPPLEEAA
jgi:hypothetical protein